jgi:hypothetical protein
VKLHKTEKTQLVEVKTSLLLLFPVIERKKDEIGSIKVKSSFPRRFLPFIPQGLSSLQKPGVQIQEAFKSFGFSSSMLLEC